MKKETQLAYIKKQLITKGYVSRNQCLKRYISRLAARISDLREDGWNIRGGKTRDGNFMYRNLDFKK